MNTLRKYYMNRKYIYALTALTFFALTGCVKLDTLPEGDTVTSSQKGDVLSKDPSKAIAGVNAIFAQFSQYEPNYSALGNRARHNDIGFPSVMFFSDANGYDLVSKATGYNWMQADLNFSDRDFSSLNCQIVWNDMYSIIYTTNSVVGAISEDTEDPTSQFYLAQGLATRAFSYWVLAQLYQFDYAGHKTSLCVPIITNENSNQAALSGAPRATVDEVYTLINSDINKAIDLLTSAQDGGITRADKRYISLAVAYGLRARINLTMEKWADAAADATKAINASDATPASISDVSRPYFWDISEGDWMWGIIISETDDVVSSGIVNWISHMGSLNYGYANYSGGMKINKALYNSIPATDVRKGWWLDASRTSPNLTTADEIEWMDYYYGAYTQVKFAPYQNIVGNSINANDIPLMRIEEMYLIKAEAEAMSGGDGKTTLENFVKQYRDPSYVCTVTAAADVQKEVFHQRRIELWGEGLSWFDIMRLKTGVDRRGGGFPNATMVFNIQSGDNILLWRIPEKEIQANPGLNPEDNNPAAPAPTPVPDI
jgi:starch-binding outer membrane protein, SusD/RagB family